MSPADPQQPARSPGAEVDFRKPELCIVGACAEVSTEVESVRIRNSTKPDTVVEFTPDEWRTLVDAIKKGEFDL